MVPILPRGYVLQTIHGLSDCELDAGIPRQQLFHDLIMTGSTHGFLSTIPRRPVLLSPLDPLGPGSRELTLVNLSLRILEPTTYLVTGRGWQHSL